MALLRRMAFTSLPCLVTMVCRGRPTVWRGRHRLILCWLVGMPAVPPGRKPLAEMAKGTPAALTAWRFGRLLTPLLARASVVWWRRSAWPLLPPAHGVLSLLGDGTQADTRGTKHPVGSQDAASSPLGCTLRAGDGGVGRDRVPGSLRSL
jgi:hypothetical protein